MDLAVSTRVVDGRTVVVLDGVADLASIPVLHDQLRRIVLDRPGETIVVDLDGLVALDDVALGLLLGAAATAREHDGDVEVVCGGRRLRERLAATRFDQAVAVSETIA